MYFIIISVIKKSVKKTPRRLESLSSQETRKSKSVAAHSTSKEDDTKKTPRKQV